MFRFESGVLSVNRPARWAQALVSVWLGPVPHRAWNTDGSHW